MSLALGHNSEWQGNYYRKLGEKNQSMLLQRQTIDLTACCSIFNVLKISDELPSLVDAVGSENVGR